MKRFYQAAQATIAEDGFQISLDGNIVRTPSRRMVAVPTQALAEAMAGEWAAQGEQIKPDSMPLTQLAMTALDRVAAERPAMEESVIGHLDTDLLCYRAAPPAAIAARQAALWGPWLAWFAGAYGTALETTTALAALRQPPAAHRAMAARVASLDDFNFAALQLAVGLTGSLVLGLALLDRAITPEMVEAAFYAEEDFKAEFYCEDFHGRAPHEEKRREAVRRDLAAVSIFLDLLTG